MIYYIYKTINLKNGKYYLGKRQYDGIDPYSDPYMGSGNLIKRAIKKYGKENFKKVVLKVYKSLKEVNAKERELINEKVILDPQCYNIALGGFGGNLGSKVRKKLLKLAKDPIQRAKISAAINDPIIKAKISKSMRKTMSDPKWKKKFSKIQKEVQNLPYNRKRNSEKQKIAQSRIDVIEKKRISMNSLYKNDKFKLKHSKSCQTKKFREKQRKKILNKKWIHNEKFQKYVDIIEIDVYLKKGWELGMKPRV